MRNTNMSIVGRSYKKTGWELREQDDRKRWILKILGVLSLIFNSYVSHYQRVAGSSSFEAAKGAPLQDFTSSGEKNQKKGKLTAEDVQEMLRDAVGTLVLNFPPD